MIKIKDQRTIGSPHREGRGRAEGGDGLIEHDEMRPIHERRAQRHEQTVRHPEE